MQDKPKLIFGLSPLATFINALVFLFFSQVFYALKFLSQIPEGLSYKDLSDDFKFVDNVPFYYDMPLLCLSIVMGLRWVEYKFKVPYGDMSWKAVRFKYIYLLSTIILLEFLFRFLILITLA